MKAPLESALAEAGLVTVEETARMTRLSRRQIDRLRKRRPHGFPREYALGSIRANRVGWLAQNSGD